MTDTLVLFLPTDSAPYRWLRIVGDVVAARGEGLPLPGTDENGPVVVTPADSVALHWADLPDRSPAQSVAAARLLAADASATPIDDLHVAVGREAGRVDRPIGVVAATRMQAWLADLAADGIDPRVLVPAPMLLPRPGSGYIRADLGGDTVVRGATTGFADEAGLTDLLTGGVAPDEVALDALEAAIVAAVADPALDLRQGPFARRKRTLDWASVRRAGWLAIAILSVSLLMSIVEIARYSLAADALEQRADLLARGGLARGETVNDADRQLDARLARLRGGGAGFSTTAAALFAAIRSVPGVEVLALSFDTGGNLRATIAAESEGQVTDIVKRVAADGFTVSTGTFAANAGRVSGDVTVGVR